jgi:hypothetical protein
MSRTQATRKPFAAALRVVLRDVTRTRPADVGDARRLSAQVVSR